MSRIDDCTAEYKGWINKLGISTISDLTKITENGDTSWLINVSETWQQQKIAEIALKLKEDIAKKRIILISGPSSSGKTSFAARLQLHLRVLGIKAVSISLDDYYIEKPLMPKNSEGKPDYEAFESIDYELFNENLHDLIEHGKATVPIYDFDDLTPPKTRDMTLAADEVIIIEGIHGLNPKLTYNIPDENKYKIYCTALTALCLDDGTRVRSRDNRLMRRAIRDFYFRDASFQLTFDLWPHVEEGAEKNIYPFTDSADVIFNSSLLYEPCVYKKHINKLFRRLPKTLPEKYRENIEILKRIVEHCPSIEDALTPRTSLIREFVGGSTLFL